MVQYTFVFMELILLSQVEFGKIENLFLLFKPNNSSKIGIVRQADPYDSIQTPKSLLVSIVEKSYFAFPIFTVDRRNGTSSVSIKLHCHLQQHKTNFAS